MKRDMDLIRRILLEAEQDDSDQGLSDFLIPGYSADQIGYHVNLLKNAGLIEANIGFDNGSVKVGSYDINHMTFAGHDFLDDIRNDSVWVRVQEKLAKVGGDASLEVVRTLAAQIVLEILR